MITLNQYVKRKNGVAIGNSKSFRNNMQRAFGAKNFSVFWQHWNPIFSYYLGKCIFKPLKRFLSSAFALVITFIFCGLLHDMVGLLVKGSTQFLFSFWFLFMGIFVLLSHSAKHNFNHKAWVYRALINCLLIAACFVCGLTVSRWLNWELSLSF